MRRVIVLTSDTGAGHRSASRALVAGTTASPERGLELIELDPYRGDDPFWTDMCATDAVRAEVRGGAGSGLADRAVTWYGPVIRQVPWLWGAAFRGAAMPGAALAYHLAYGRKVAARIHRAVDLSGAVGVVSVHPLCTRAMAVGAPRLPCTVVVTDLVDVHPFWAGHPGAHHVVATTEAAGTLAKLGVAPGQIRTLGLPLGPAFARIDRTAREMRVHLGLDPDREVVLFMGGGAGAGDMEAVVRACDRDRAPGARGVPVFVVVCGRNDRLRASVESRAWRGPVRVLGFEPAIHEWMIAATVIVTKPGSMTVAESLAVGRPILLGPPLPGQEEGNVPLVVDSGAGIAYRDPAGASDALGAMLADPVARWEMGQRGLRMRRGDATTRILDLVQSMIRCA
jgi:UDP-N-acetylglucosamine:LPS N-acetylglucosamine transferase